MRRGDCGWARRHLWRYLDKTLPAPVSRQVEAHLAVCVPCRAEFARAQEALESLRLGKPLTPDQQRLLKRSASAPAWKRTAAALLLLILVGVGAYLWWLPSDTLFTRLSERDLETEPIPTLTPDALSPEPNFEDSAKRSSVPKIEPLNLQDALQPAPPPTETPKPSPSPKVQTEPRSKPPAPAVPQPRKPLPPTNPRPRRANPQPAPKPQPRPTAPTEGTVEVYDEAGNLIRREQLQEKR
ncbi:MAG: hypothetical protein KatS3mg019_0421 [Fimbriimonadales bacterium]|nr:MAG: hypothetical protein KatS3mg019_0421 [Fimbriimonadales bacterium]